MSREPRDAPQFYLTAPSPCPYLPQREERKVFTHLIGRRAVSLNDTLTAIRRSQTSLAASQTIAYRPACETCRACVSVRVKAQEFRSTKSLRRVVERNADLRSSVVRSEPTSEQYALFRTYLDARHADGGMADMTVLDYSMMVEDSHVESRLVEYRTGPVTAASAGRLAAVCLTDVLADGLSMGLLVLRSRTAVALARQLHDHGPHRAARGNSASPISISAIGSMARRRWRIRHATCRRNVSA